MKNLTPSMEMTLNEIEKINTQIKDNQGRNLEEVNQKINLFTDIIEILLKQKRFEPIENAREERLQEIKAVVQR
jgi:uncharacterized protein YxjI